MSKTNGKKTGPETPPAEKRTARTMEFLTVPFSQDELLALGAQLARALQAQIELEERMETMKLRWKEEADGLAKSIRATQRKLNARGEMRDVQCDWIFESPTPEEKTLVRLDIGEVVRVVPMQMHDRQDDLPIKMEGPGENLQLTPPPTNGNGKQVAAGDVH